MGTSAFPHSNGFIKSGAEGQKTEKSHEQPKRRHVGTGDFLRSAIHFA